MNARLSKDTDSIVYVMFENGRCYRLEAVLARRRADIAAADVRRREQIKNLWWRFATRSRDMPNSRAARADLSDGGRAAERIRREKSTYCNMWISTQRRNGRMSRAIQFLSEREGFAYGSPEHRELGRFLWSVFHNGAERRAETLGTFNLSEPDYLVRLGRYTRLLDEEAPSGRQPRQAV